jgi:dihydrolipoamide dehydrogenase
MVDHYDLAVIGSGPGGYVAAIRAAQLGLKCVCIDKRETFGGTCLNVGCIPSKSLLESTQLFMHVQKDGEIHGIEGTELKVNFPQLMERKKQVVKGLVDGVQTLFQKNNVTSLHGAVEFMDAHRLKITTGDQSQEITADSILIATGSEPIPLSIIPFDEHQVVSSTGALSLEQIPQRLIVIGGGVIGVELASVYQRLGSKVTIIEMLDHICPALDATMSKQLLQVLKKQGIEFQLSTQIMTAVVQPNEVILTTAQNDVLKNSSADVVLVAVGRRPFTQNLKLEKAGITTNKRGFIPVDESFRTSQSHIYAIGDVIEGIMLAHRASAEGVAVVESLKGDASPIDYLAIPNVVYTHPEVASVGLSEEEAKQAGLNLIIGTSFFRGNSRARCAGETEGLVKIIGDEKSRRLLGMHILGAHASEMIAEGMLAMQKKVTIEELAKAAQAHPTLSEAIKEAALDALKQAIHH